MKPYHLHRVMAAIMGLPIIVTLIWISGLQLFFVAVAATAWVAGWAYFMSKSFK